MNTFPITVKELNGLRVLLLPREEMQAVTVLALIGVGSRYEAAETSGLSHFLEHMFFKGTEKRPSAKAIAEAVESLGGEFNAFTGEEYTGFYVKTAAAHLETGADVVADILLHPLFPVEEIEREKGVIVEEIRMYTDMPMRHIHHLWQEVMFGTHALGRRIDGREETVTSFGQQHFLDYTKQHYHRGNAVIAVAGNFDEKKIVAQLEQLFGELAPGAETKPEAAPTAMPAEQFLHERREQLDQAHLMVGVPGISLKDDDWHAASLLATVLGQGMSSRLFGKVREREGLAYMVRTMLDGYTDTGTFVTQAGVRLDGTQRALELILEEYDLVMQEPVTDAELTKAKEMMRGRLVLGLEETNAIAMFACEQELLEDELLTPMQIIERIEAVTAADVQRVAQRLLHKDLRAVALLSPHQETDELEKLVVSP